MIRRLALLAFLGLGIPAFAEESQKPNLLLVTLDTTRADHLGCYGAKDAQTPVMDGLAGGGIRFDQVISPAPLTLPAHVTMFTGQNPVRHGVRDNAGFTLPRTVETLATRLKTAGYATAAFVSAAVLDRSTGIARGFDIFDDQVRVGPREWFAWEERGASQTVDSLVPRLGELKPPFFLWVHFYDPHLPYVPPEPFRTRFRDRPYAGEIAFTDQELGRLLAQLKQRGLDQNLLIAVAGDHGESLGEHGEATHDIFVYQATQRVPLIIKGPGIPAGKVVRDTVGLIDLAPTLTDLLGMPPFSAAEGRSLVPAWRGQSLPPRSFAVECLHPTLGYGWAPLFGVVQGSLKFIEAPRPELYDLLKDPGEKTNLLPRFAKRGASPALWMEKYFGPDRHSPISSESSQPIDSERLEQLRALGYAVGGETSGTKPIDPKDGIRLRQDLDRARALQQRGRPEEAVAILGPLLEKNPGNLQARLALGNALIASGKMEEGLASHREAVRRAPNDYLTHFNLANALGQARDPQKNREAETEYRKALELHPRHHESVRGLAELLLTTGRPDQARVLLEDKERQEVFDPHLLVMRGVLESARGNWSAAGRAFQTALAQDPSSASALEGLGRAAYAQGQPKQAAEYYRQALTRSPTPALARTLGAILLYDLNDPEGARLAFQEALRLEPQGPDADQVRDILRSLNP